MPKIENTEHDNPLFTVFSASQLQLTLAKQAELYLKVNADVLKSYQGVVEQWLRHRQQDVEEGIQVCQMVSAKPDGTASIDAYRDWWSSCADRWSDDMMLLSNNFAQLASQLHHASTEPVHTVAIQVKGTDEEAMRAAK
jgi:hypothetical protein